MIPIVSLHRTCMACPSQWDAEDEEGRYLYIRFRWGRLTVERALDEQAWWAGRSETLVDAQVGEPLDGCMSDDVMLRTAGLTLRRPA